MPSLATDDKNMSVTNKVNGYVRPLNNAIETNLTGSDGSKITAIQASISSLSSVILSSSSCGLNEGISSGSSIGVGVQIIEDSNVVETVHPNNRIKKSVETTRKKLIRIRQLRKSKSKKRKYRLINASKKQPSKKAVVKKQINEEFSSVFGLINDMIETVEKSLSNEESTEKNMIKILLTDMWMLKSGQDNKTMVGCAINKRKSPINSNSNYSRLTLLKARRNYEQFVKNSGENDNENENENIIDNNEWDSSRIATNSCFENDKIQIKSMRNTSSKNLNRQNDETIRKIDIHDEMTSHHDEIVEEASDSKTIVENEQNCSKIVDLNPLGSNKMEKEESNCTTKRNCNDEGTLNAGEEEYENLEKKFGRNELFTTNNNKNNNQSYLKSNEFEYESESSCKTNSSLNNNELDCSLKMIQQQQQQQQRSNNDNVFVENIFSSHSLINKIDKQSDSDFITPTTNENENSNNNSNTIKEKKNNGDVILGNKDLNNNKFESTNNTVVLNDKSTNISNISTPSNNINNNNNNNSYLKIKEEDLLYSLPTTSSSSSPLLSSSVLINLKQKNNEIEDILERESSVDSDSKKTTIQIHSLNTTHSTHYENNNNNHNEMIASKNNNTSQPNTQTNKKKLKNEQEEEDEEDANQITNNNNINIPTYNNSNINNNGCSISNNNNNHDDGVEILKDKCSDIMMNIENNNNNKDEVVEGNKTRIGDNESLSSSSVSTNSSFNLNDNSTDEYNNLNPEFLGGNNNNTNNTKKTPLNSVNSIAAAQSSNESGSNIKKVVLKNNEIVLIEDCTDDDDEDYLRLEKSKSQESAEIIPLSSSTENVMSRSYYSKSSQKSKKQVYNGEDESLVNNNSEDPYVKAALERFDAFCKSKSTQNLDQNPTMTSPLLVNRQKSPYLSRKSANKPSEEQMNIGSFIKKRQARIDPKTQLTRNDSFEETTKPNSNRSISETRTESSQFRSLSSDKSRINKHSIKPIDRSNEASTAQLTSSLAKKFLGSLTPQLEPVQINDVHLEEPFELMQPKQSRENVPLEKPNIDSDNQESKGGLTEKKKLTSSKTIELARTKPQSPPSEPPPPKKNITLSSSTSSTISSVSSASSDNSATSSPTHKANKPVNIIKLEVYNSKKQAKPNEQNSSGSNISKPPLPPTPTVNTNVSTATNPSSWRSKLRSIYSEAPIIDGSQKPNVTQQPSNETATVTKVNSNKPISRVIPLEIKNKSTTNSTSNQQTNKQPATSNTITRGSSLYSSLKNIEKPTNTSSLPSNRSQSPPPTASISTAQPTTNFTSSVQDRIRSLSISYRDENERTNRLRDEYAKFNVEVNDASTVDNTHDPIAEKACSNFMHKLKEFQRQQSFQVYTPLSTTTSTSPITTVPTAPTVSSYTGPIVSARTANTSPYIASSFANSVYSPVTTTYQPPSTYSSYSSAKYSTIGPSTVNSYLSSSNDSELSTSGSLTHRPYVSAIRKRRTLFSDELMSDESSNSSFSKTSSIFSQDSTSTTFQDPSEILKPKIDTSKPNLDDNSQSNNKNGIGYSHARNRPLSIVNEEAAAAAAAAANSNGLNRSLTFNESHLLKSYQNQTSRENTIRENEPTNQTPKPKIQIKKSNSVNSPNSKPEINKARSKLSNSEKDQTLSSSTFNVAASNVAKINNITPTKVNSNPQKPDTKKSTDRSSFEQPNISNIKLQNEIAIVTSMVPKKKEIPIPIPTAINNNSDDNDTCLNGQSINRIRSLDSKSREKYKSCIPNSNSTKKQQSSPNSSSNTTNTTTNSIPITPNIQTNLIPSCYLYPKSSSTDNSNSNNSNSSKSSLSIGSEINTENIQNTEKGTVRRKSQVFLANGKLNNADSSGNKADVFERLSKRTNSMKNLSNNQTKPNKNIGNSSDNEKTFSSNDEASTSQEYGLPQHNNHHNTSNSTANNLSKTSVFERLYKSNIAAHMNNHQNEINNTVEKNSLKKNMSVSSANLVSAVANQNINTTNSYISKNKTNGISFTKQRPKIIGKISDEVDDNNSLENFEKCENSMKDNEEIDSNLIKKDPNFIKPSSSSFLSHKLMDLFNK